MVIALHDKKVYSAHILDLDPGHKYTVYVQAKQDINNMVAYSPWVYTNKTTSMSSEYFVVGAIWFINCSANLGESLN